MRAKAPKFDADYRHVIDSFTLSRPLKHPPRLRDVERRTVRTNERSDRARTASAFLHLAKKTAALRDLRKYPLNGNRQFDVEKKLTGIQVIFAGFVDYANHSMFRRESILKNRI
jgi:hypothetical protein